MKSFILAFIVSLSISACGGEPETAILSEGVDGILICVEPTDVDCLVRVNEPFTYKNDKVLHTLAQRESEINAQEIPLDCTGQVTKKPTFDASSEQFRKYFSDSICTGRFSKSVEIPEEQSFQGVKKFRLLHFTTYVSEGEK